MEKAEEWCSDEGPVYETLPVGGTSRFAHCFSFLFPFLPSFFLSFLFFLSFFLSCFFFFLAFFLSFIFLFHFFFFSSHSRITLLKGETMYVRFFIPEDMYCHSIVLVPRPYYGTLSWSFSTLEAYPEFSTVTGWRNVCVFSLPFSYPFPLFFPFICFVFSLSFLHFPSSHIALFSIRGLLGTKKLLHMVKLGLYFALIQPSTQNIMLEHIQECCMV